MLTKKIKFVPSFTLTKQPQSQQQKHMRKPLKSNVI